MLSFRPVRAFVVALLVALPVALLPAGGAQAASRTVQGGRLDWGIKSSFQSYVTGPIAQGGWSLNGGAATVGGSQFRFHSAAGSYDSGTGAFRAGFSGGVRFVGHRKSDGSYELDLTISRPTVRVSGGGGTLYADMVSKEKESGRVTTTYQVPLAALNLSGINMVGGGNRVALNSVPATLTSQGATAFAGYYTAGTALDPISLSVDVAAEQKPAGKPGGGSQGASGGQDAGGKAGSGGQETEGGKKQTAGAFQDAAVDWGIRRTYREYVTGSIAQGTWTLSGGAEDGGALFRFPRGKGTYDAGKATLDADFAGSVRFTGTGLDLTLSKVSVRVEDGTGTLSADVADATTTGAPRKAVPLVTFTARGFKPKAGLASITEAPARLTAQGAKAFGSLYAAGTVMDPVSLAVTVDKKAELPALPDLGSDVTVAAQPETPAVTASPETGTAATAPPSSSAGAGTYGAIGAGVLVVAGLGFLAVRRNRRGTPGTGAN
ncbi:HtaA domain-containing protein [Streptomyces sp. NPDC051569]|uniref:HtaA domain-containing protein n=1 Tax=Streptomyces sp. NPDC051569 TaxID=3365661 RepID=UPI0037A39154